MEMIDPMDSVVVDQRTGKYGNVGRQKANALYNNYKRWMKENRIGVVPMKFTEWIKWAAEKGIVPKKMAADAEVDVEKEKVDVAPIVNSISRTGKIVAWSIIGVTAIGLCIYIFKPVASATAGAPAAPTV